MEKKEPAKIESEKISIPRVEEPKMATPSKSSETMTKELPLFMNASVEKRLKDGGKYDEYKNALLFANQTKEGSILLHKPTGQRYIVTKTYHKKRELEPEFTIQDEEKTHEPFRVMVGEPSTSGESNKLNAPYLRAARRMVGGKGRHKEFIGFIKDFEIVS